MLHAIAVKPRLKILRFLSFALVLASRCEILVAQSNCDFPWRGQINDIEFVSSDIGFAAGENGGIFKTSDGGETWVQLASYTGITFNDVEFLDTKTGIAAGYAGMLKTSDGCATWKSIDSRLDSYVNSCYIVDATTYYVFTNNWIQKTQMEGPRGLG